MKKRTFFASLCVSGALFALPSNPNVISGNATFDYSTPNKLTVNVTTDRTIIEWSDFSISDTERVRMIVPQDSSVVLNRVTGTQLSSLNRETKCLGVFYLVNTNGITVGPSVNWAPCALLLSTLDVPNSEFLAAGDMNFSGTSGATLSLEGYLGAHAADVLILGGHLVNQAYLEALSGVVGLAAGEAVTVSPGSTQVLTIVPQAGSASGTGINHSGVINTHQAELKVDGPRYTQGIAFTGSLTSCGEAGALSGAYLFAEGGSITLSDRGFVQAVPKNPDMCEIQVLAETITLQDQARVTTASDWGAGKIYIGGGFQGTTPPLYASQSTSVTAGVQIMAGSGIEGDGNQIVVWSNGNTSFYGFASSQGGVSSGNGGTIEISGVQNLDYQGSVDIRAPQGTPGTLLLDPQTVKIGHPSSRLVRWWNNDKRGLIHIDALNQALAKGNVVIATPCGEGGCDGDIVIEEPLEIQSKCHHLVLRANRDIVINQSLSFRDAAGEVGILHLTAGRNIQFQGGVPFKVIDVKNLGLVAGGEILLTEDLFETNCENVTFSPRTCVSSWKEIGRHVVLPAFMSRNVEE